MATKKKAKTAPAKKAAVKAKAADMKTKPTSASVDAFIDKTPNATRREDAKALLALFRRVTGEEPVMWGPSIIGFGQYHYKYESGREGDMCVTGFSPRSAASVVYLMGGVKDDPLFERLGKHRLGGSCLYINRLADVDMKTLEALIRKSVAYMRKTYPE